MQTYVLLESKGKSNSTCGCDIKEENVLVVSNSFGKIVDYIESFYWLTSYDLRELDEFLLCNDIVKKSDDVLYNLEIFIVDVLE